MIYKVNFSGFAYVEADSEDDAIDLYIDLPVYSEQTVTSVKDVYNFVIEI